MASSLDKLACNLCGTSGIPCDKCKDIMELINREMQNKQDKGRRRGGIKREF